MNAGPGPVEPAGDAALELSLLDEMNLFCDALDVTPESRSAWLDVHVPVPSHRRRVERRLAREDRIRASLGAGLRAPLIPLIPARSDPEACTPPDDLAQRGVVIADRYVLEASIGSGTFGHVYRATDRVVERPVAVKIARWSQRTETRAFVAELSAYLRLDVAGLVRLLDFGTDPVGRYLVMELVGDGRPFPGEELPVSWERLEPLAIALLGILFDIHALGVAHGDLKPGNVLVDRAGRVHVLDLRLARGAWTEVRGAETEFGAPAYAAPEVLQGAPPSVEADLYAVGLMLYCALTGVVPHTEDPDEFFGLRTAGAFETAELECARVPVHVTDVLRRLLDPDPVARGGSAWAVMETLRRGAVQTEDALGVGRFVRAVFHTSPATELELQALFSAHNVLSHLPEDAARLLFGRTSGDLDSVVAELEHWVRDRRARFSERGFELSREQLVRLEWAPPSPVRETPESDDEAVELVHRLLTLSGPDGTAECIAAAAGLPSTRVDVALRALVDAGVATDMGDGRFVARFRPPPLGADRLPSPAMLHARLAAAAEPLSVARVVHAYGAGEFDAAVRRTVGAAESAVDQLDPQRAVELLVRALRVAGSGEGALSIRRDLLLHLLRAALNGGTVRDVALALSEIRRWRSEPTSRDATHSRDIEALAEIADTAWRVMDGPQTSSAAVEQLSAREPYPDWQLELLRRVVLVRSCRSGASGPRGTIEADALAWAATQGGNADVTRSAADWLAWTRYRDGDYAGAARLHESRLEFGAPPRVRVTALLNAASAHLEAGNLARALECADAARGIAVNARQPFHEGRAIWLVRSARYRRGDWPEPDARLVASVDALRVPYLLANVLLNEAASAWRRGDVNLARRRAAEAQDGFRSTFPPAAAVAAMLAEACGAPPQPGALRPLDGADARLPGAVVQALGLAALAPRGLDAAGRDRLRAAAERLRTDELREVLSPAEALHFADRRSAS